MFIELVEWLRCVNEHEKTWLVASTGRMSERDIVEGVLGCPVCKAEYPISNGIADFSATDVVPPHEDKSAERGGGTSYLHGSTDELEGAVRLAALLNLDEPGGFVVLCGEWGALAQPLLCLQRGVHLLLVNPVTAELSGGGVSIATAGRAIPLRAGSARGIAVDSAQQHGSRGWLDSAVAALRPEGHLLAPATIAVPEGTRVLALDDQWWVAAREDAIAVTPIARRPRS